MVSLTPNFIKERRALQKIKKGPRPGLNFEPKIVKNKVTFKTLPDTNGRIGVLLGEEGEQYARQSCLDFMEKMFLDLYRNEMRIPEIPENTIAISFSAHPNYTVGKDHNSFIIPDLKKYRELRKGCGENSHSTQLSENLKAFYLIESDWERYLWGMCYYPTRIDKKKIGSYEVERNLIKMELMKMRTFPRTDRLLGAEYIKNKVFGRYCDSTKGNVAVWTGKEDGQVVHILYDPIKRKRKFVPCEECARDFKRYSFKRELEQYKDQCWWGRVMPCYVVKSEDIKEVTECVEPKIESPEGTESEWEGVETEGSESKEEEEEEPELLDPEESNSEGEEEEPEGSELVDEEEPELVEPEGSESDEEEEEEEPELVEPEGSESDEEEDLEELEEPKEVKAKNVNAEEAELPEDFDGLEDISNFKDAISLD